MIKRIAIIGATGLLGKPVTSALLNAGFEITALVRNAEKARKELPAGIHFIEGNMKNEADLRKVLNNQDAIYLNLSVKQNEKENDWHTESDGIKKLLPLAKEAGIRRIAYLSSLVMRYQGMNDFRWWVFAMKQQAVELIKSSGIPSVIFYPSTFMESLSALYKAGPFMLLAGESKFKQHFIAADDYARQVVQSFRVPVDHHQEYVVQGPAGFTSDEAVALFAKHYRRKLFTMKVPLGLIGFYGTFIQKMNYGYHILEALNKYPERFEADRTWSTLGKPVITVEEFAKNL